MSVSCHDPRLPPRADAGKRWLPESQDQTSSLLLEAISPQKEDSQIFYSRVGLLPAERLPQYRKIGLTGRGGARSDLGKWRFQGSVLVGDRPVRPGAGHLPPADPGDMKKGPRSPGGAGSRPLPPATRPVCVCVSRAGGVESPSKGKAAATGRRGSVRPFGGETEASARSRRLEQRAGVERRKAGGCRNAERGILRLRRKGCGGKSTARRTSDPVRWVHATDKQAAEKQIIESFGLEGTSRGHPVQPPRSEQGHR